MKTETVKTKRKVILARHYGMCFGVRDAYARMQEIAESEKVTVLGNLVHNPIVTEELERKGVKIASGLDVVRVKTKDVVITAHGASERDRERWTARGHRLWDTTCPLVHKAHRALESLVAEGYFPVIIGKRGHVEVRGLAGDYPEAIIVSSVSDIVQIPKDRPIGVVAQTTQPLERVNYYLQKIRQRTSRQVRFIDTVCQPTKDRQNALVELCTQVKVVIIVGGRHSNNTSQLVAKARVLGVEAYHVERTDELQREWVEGVSSVGVSAGTSTLEKTVKEVVKKLEEW